MAKELLIRKQKGTHSPQCTSYRIVEPAWRFTLETCDEDVTGVIKDDVGNTIATVSAGAPAIVSRLGSYNVCVTGNGMGSLYVEWTDDTYVDQQCCNEVRKEFEQMLDDAIANVESKIPTSSVTVRGGENTEVTKSGNTYTVNATDTVTTLKAGNGIALQRNGYEYTVSSKVANVVAGENVSIQEGTESDGSPRFEISAVDTKPDVDKAYVDSKIAAIVDKDTVTTLVAGNANVTVVDSGTGGNHAYTISTVDTKPDVTKAYVDEQIAAIVDKDTVTVVNAGENVSVSDTGTGGNHNYTISAVDTVTTVKAGNNVSVSKSGNEYTVSATIPSDTNTITTLTAGNNITLNDTGTGGNHNYVVTAKDTVTTVKAGNNVSVSKNGDEYTVTATDTVITVKAGNNVSVSKSGNEYTVSATISPTSETLVNAGTGVTVTDSGTGGNHNYTISATDTNTVTTVTGDVYGQSISPYPSSGIKVTETTDSTTGNKTYDVSLTNKIELSSGWNSASLGLDGLTIRYDVGRVPFNLNSALINPVPQDASEPKRAWEITGLANRSFDPNNFTSGRAATEDQLKVLADRIAALEARL